MTEQFAGQIAVEAIFYASIGFVAGVSLFWAWWQGQLGWSIIAKSLALTIAVFPAMLHYWFGVAAPTWLMYVSIYALWLIPPILAWRLVVIWRLQRRGLDVR